MHVETVVTWRLQKWAQHLAFAFTICEDTPLMVRMQEIYCFMEPLHYFSSQPHRKPALRRPATT